MAANDIDTNGRVQVTFTGTAASAGSLTFTTTAFGQNNCAGQLFAQSGSNPAVTVSPPPNSAPVLAPAGNPTLGTILEDPAADDGDDIPTLIAAGGAGYITDADAGALRGIAIVAADTTNGTWQYSTNSGGAWTAIGAVAVANARLLASAPANRLRFVPNANYFGSSTVTLRAWDQTTGTNGGLANTTTSGGTTAFSSATDTAAITVLSVNDVPSFTKGGDQVVAEDAGAQSVAGWATSLSRGPANESGQTLAFAITGNSNAALFSAGPTVSPTGTLTFTPAANANGTSTISLVIADNGGTANGGIDTSAAQSFVVSVGAVNDAPACADDAASTDEDTPLNDSLACTDVEGDTLTYAEVAGPSDGTLLLNPGGTFTYTPDPDFNGSDSFTFTADDDSAVSNVATFTITVPAVNDAPVCGDDTATTRRGRPAGRLRLVHRCRR